jgi:hypothetical protein
MLYRITDKPIFEEHPELSQIQEFASLPDKVLKWIFMVYDWDGPFRKLPITKRREIAANNILYTANRRTNFDKYVTKLLKGEVAEVNMGIAAFGEQQYDEDRETLEALKDGIRDIRRMMKKEVKDFKDAKDKADLAKKLREMAEEKKILEDIFELREGLSADEEDFERSASVLDEYMENED